MTQTMLAFATHLLRAALALARRTAMLRPTSATRAYASRYAPYASRIQRGQRERSAGRAQARGAVGNGRTDTPRHGLGWKQAAALGLAAAVFLPQQAAAQQLCEGDPRMVFLVDNSGSVGSNGSRWIRAIDDIAEGIQSGTNIDVEFAVIWWSNAACDGQPINDGICRSTATGSPEVDPLTELHYYPPARNGATPTGWVTDIIRTPADDPDPANRIAKPSNGSGYGSDADEVALADIRRMDVFGPGEPLDLTDSIPFMLFFSDVTGAGAPDSQVLTPPNTTGGGANELRWDLANPIVGVPTPVAVAGTRTAGEWEFLRQPQGDVSVTFRGDTSTSTTITKGYPAFREIFAIRSAAASAGGFNDEFDAITGPGKNYSTGATFDVNQTIIDAIVDAISDEPCLSTDLDYGDAPVSFNGTSAPRHRIVAGLHVGTAPDADDDAKRGSWLTNGTGDDADGTDDEDGVATDALKLYRVPGSGITATLKVTGIVNDLVSDAQLVCWIDFDENNEFDNVAERSAPGFIVHTLEAPGVLEDFHATAYHDPGAGAPTNNPVFRPDRALGDPLIGDTTANIRDGEVLVLEIGAVIQNGDTFEVHLRGDSSGDGRGTIEICTGSTGTGCGATITIREGHTTKSVSARTYTANANGKYLKISQTRDEIRVDGVVYNAIGSPTPCTQTGITDTTWTTGNIPADCSGDATLLWTGLTDVPDDTTPVMSRCRLTTEDGSTDPAAADFFSDSSPSPLGPARDGEDWDTQLDPVPTAATIGDVSLESRPVTEVIAGLGGETEALLGMLVIFDPARARALADAPAGALETALIAHLDPDGNGRVALLRWQTLEERGTIGFIVERQAGDGDWRPINGGMLPALIDAPLGGEYWLADPRAWPGETYRYRLVEQEAWGTRKTYGPYELTLD